MASAISGEASQRISRRYANWATELSVTPRRGGVERRGCGPVRERLPSMNGCAVESRQRTTRGRPPARRSLRPQRRHPGMAVRSGPASIPVLHLTDVLCDTLTPPKTVPITPQQRAAFVSLLTDMIVTWRQEQHVERARAAAPRKDAHRPEEPPGHSPAP